VNPNATKSVKPEVVSAAARRAERKREFKEVLRPALFIWCVFVVTIPFYLFESGLPQPGNLLVLVLIPFAFKYRRLLPPELKPTLSALAWFVVWVCLVNFGWALVMGKWAIRYTVFPFYYVFNLCVVFIAFVAYRRYGELFLRLTIYSVLLAVMLQVVAALLSWGGGQGMRGQLFFNNPNQLGYYSILAACSIAVAQRRLKMNLAIAGTGLTACAYLALVSASRAALVGIALLFIFQVFSNPRIIIATSVLVVMLLVVGGPIASALEVAQARMEQMQKRVQKSFAEERGYDRLWQYKEYMVIGAGEGETSRFSDPWRPKQEKEIHSSAATILFSYGVIGSLLFLMFIFRAIRGAPLRLIVMLLPTVGYTLAHQGLRFTMLWIMLTCFVIAKLPHLAERTRRTQRRSFGSAPA
jgi:hypothetical protein